MWSFLRFYIGQQLCVLDLGMLNYMYIIPINCSQYLAIQWFLEECWVQSCLVQHKVSNGHKKRVWLCLLPPTQILFQVGVSLLLPGARFHVALWVAVGRRSRNPCTRGNALLDATHRSYKLRPLLNASNYSAVKGRHSTHIQMNSIFSYYFTCPRFES